MFTTEDVGLLESVADMLVGSLPSMSKTDLEAGLKVVSQLRRISSDIAQQLERLRLVEEAQMAEMVEGEVEDVN